MAKEGADLLVLGSGDRLDAYPRGLIVTLLCCSLLFVLVATKPAYNWDMLPYLAIAQGTIDAPDAQAALHHRTYERVAANVGAARFDALIGVAPELPRRDAEYRQVMAADPVAFASQLPFYAVKPLYPWCIAILSALGLEPVTASVGITRVAWLAMGLVVYGLLRLRLAQLPAFGLALSLMALPTTRALASYSTPDALSNCLVLLAGWLLLRPALIKPPGSPAALAGAAPALGCLFIAQLARPDTLLLICLVCAWLMLQRRRALAVAAIAVAATSYLLQVTLSENYGWLTLFHHSFVEFLHYPDRVAVALDWGSITSVYLAQLSATRQFGLMLCLGAIVAAVRLRVWGWRDSWGQLLVIHALFMAEHWMLFPDQKDRMLVGCYLFVLAGLVSLLAERDWLPAGLRSGLGDGFAAGGQSAYKP